LPRKLLQVEIEENKEREIGLRLIDHLSFSDCQNNCCIVGPKQKKREVEFVEVMF